MPASNHFAKHIVISPRVQAKYLILQLIFLMILALSVSAWPIPDTGQTTCYDEAGNVIDPCPAAGEAFYGQDGNFLINPPSYTKLDANGADAATNWVMVRDNVTGLIWEVKHVSDGVKDYDNPHDPDNTYTWYDSNPETNGGNAGDPEDGVKNTEAFIATLNAENFGGFSDWRIPTIEELRSIVDNGSYNPAINTEYFPNTVNTVSSYYWSASTYANDTSNAWRMSFNTGNGYNNDKSNSYYVRAVREGQDWSLDHLFINGDGTVTDNSTGLMWELKTDDGSLHDKDNKYTWNGAMGVFIAGINTEVFAGYNDWRMPTAKELSSLIDSSRYDPAIDTEYFPNTVSSYYRSSTTDAGDTSYAWGVYFYNGYDDSYRKSDSYYVRAVRAGLFWLLDHLIISEPRQGSSWMGGEDTMTITWNTQNLEGNVEISLSTQGGKDGTFSSVATTANTGAYEWKVAVLPSINFNCVLKIVPDNDPGKFTTQGLFTIKPDTIPPSTGAIVIAKTNDLTADASPDLTINSTNADFMRFALSEEDLATAAWEPYATAYSDFDISSSGGGAKNVWVEFRDQTGNIQTIHTYDTVYYDGAAPAAPIVSGFTPTHNNTPTWTWVSGGGGNGSYQYSFDGLTWTGITSMSHTPSEALPDGDHTLYVQERDDAGNWSASGPFTIRIDTVKPSPPNVSGPPLTNDTTPTWTWTPGGGGNGTYRYKLDDSNLESGAVETILTAYTPGNPLISGDHTLYVQERDSAGNWSDSGSFMVEIDAVPPSAPIVSGTTPTNDATPTFIWTSGQDPGNGAYRYKLNNADLTGAPETTAVSFTPASPLTHGFHTLYVQERDAVGNWSLSGGVMIYVDLQPPLPPTISGQSPTNDRTPSWNWTSGGGGNNLYRYKLNDGNLSEQDAMTTGTAFTPATPLNEGTHTLYVQERDLAGNWSASGMYAIDIVLTAPTVSAVSPVAATTPVWTWSGMGGAAATGRFRYKLDDNDLNAGSTQTTALSFTPAQALAQGLHTLYVQEQDGDGLWSKTGSAAVTISSPANGIIVSPLTLEVAEPGGSNTFTVRLAVKPRADVSVDFFSLNNNLCTATPANVTWTPDAWENPKTITVTDADFNLINTDDTLIDVAAAVSADPYYNGMTSPSVYVNVRDDASFTVYAVRPRYGLAGQFTDVTVYGNGFDANTRVFYTKIQADGSPQTEKEVTRTISGSTQIKLKTPDVNQDPPPVSRERYVLRITDGEKDYIESVFIVSQADLDAGKRKKALIIAGGGDGYDGDYLWEATQFCADLAYSALEFQGYSYENVQYLSSGDADSARDATLANFEKAVTQWASEPFVPGYEINELLIYMTDHGTDGRFTLKGNENLDLEAWRLRMWLDALQNAHPEIRVIVIYDACRSGSFIEILKKYPSAPYERIILTGTSADQDALFADNGRLSFSDTFWNATMKNGHLHSAFKSAEWEMLGLGQQAMIEIPAIYTQPENDLKIGLGLMTGASVIDIRKICPEQTLTCGRTGTTVWVRDIQPPDTVQRVSARIRFYDGDTEPDTAITTIPLIPQTPPPEDPDTSMIYGGDFSGFIKPGFYYVSISAVDINDKESEKVHTTVVQICAGGGVKGDLDGNGLVDPADAIIALQTLAGIDSGFLRTDFAEKPDIDVNGDFSAGLQEAIFALQKSAGY